MPSSYAHAASGQAATDPERAAEEPVDLQGKRVVVVEDEGITQMQLHRVLTQAGMIVAGKAFNGREGITVVLQERPDIVLMDIRMPILDGLEAARRILEAIPVCLIMMTGYADPENRERAEQIGASGYMQKPLTADILLPQMQEAYRRYLRRQSGESSA